LRTSFFIQPCLEGHKSHSAVPQLQVLRDPGSAAYSCRKQLPGFVVTDACRFTKADAKGRNRLSAAHRDSTLLERWAQALVTHHNPVVRNSCLVRRQEQKGLIFQARPGSLLVKFCRTDFCPTVHNRMISRSCRLLRDYCRCIYVEASKFWRRRNPKDSRTRKRKCQDGDSPYEPTLGLSKCSRQGGDSPQHVDFDQVCAYCVGRLT